MRLRTSKRPLITDFYTSNRVFFSRTTKEQFATGCNGLVHDRSCFDNNAKINTNTAWFLCYFVFVLAFSVVCLLFYRIFLFIASRHPCLKMCACAKTDSKEFSNYGGKNLSWGFSCCRKRNSGRNYQHLMPFHCYIFLFSDYHHESGSGGSAEKEYTSGDGRSH